MLNKIFEHIGTLTDELLDLQTRLVAIPAIGPLNDGPGEKDKADWLVKRLREMDLGPITEINAPDPKAAAGYRPNIAVVVPGQDSSRTFWVISHIDVVPPGDIELWENDPYILTRDGDKIIGRGVEDNHQGMVSSLLLAKALKDLGIVPPINLGLLFVADEETGSVFGMDYIVREHADMFARNDLFLVPDFGTASSETVEVAEKSMCWIKVVTEGKQYHASTPHEGLNAMVPASDLIVRTRRLYDLFPAKNDLFDPPLSTFEPTKREANVGNINTIPGRDVFYIDCRVLPEYDLSDVLAELRKMADDVQREYGVTISISTVQKEQAAPPTPEDSDIASRVMEGIRKVYKTTPRPVGIGGGTVAAVLRRAGFEAVVWSTLRHQAHQPNEYSSIANTFGDAKVMAAVLMA
ncbi:MAG: M20 family metallo-hydrolase [Desulfovibrionaceae bacterium]